MKRAVASAVLGVLLLAVTPASAHDFRPALLALTQQTPGEYEVVWRIPVEAADEAIAPLLPPGTARKGESRRTREGDRSLVERFRVLRPQGFAGATLGMAGTSAIVNEVLVRVEEGGRLTTGRFPRDGTFVVPQVPSAGAVAKVYLRLGVEHILSGIDHLAFVLALVLLATSTGAIVRAVTAFTVAHSLTLAAAALGIARLPQAPVEATIALSIMFVARELLLRRRGEEDEGEETSRVAARRHRAPTAAAFFFGLLHGLGFAGALAEVGLPEGDIPLALLCFNVGVELGQLAFVALVLLLRRALAPLLAAGIARGAGIARLCRLLLSTPATAIGVLGGYWLIERVSGFFA